MHSNGWTHSNIDHFFWWLNFFCQIGAHDQKQLKMLVPNFPIIEIGDQSFWLLELITEFFKFAQKQLGVARMMQFLVMCNYLFGNLTLFWSTLILCWPRLTLYWHDIGLCLHLWPNAFVISWWMHKHKDNPRWARWMKSHS